MSVWTVKFVVIQMSFVCFQPLFSTALHLSVCFDEKEQSVELWQNVSDILQVSLSCTGQNGDTEQCRNLYLFIRPIFGISLWANLTHEFPLEQNMSQM